MAESNKNGVHGENEATFEQCFRRLQEVVQTLSEGSLTLEEALSSFEEGMRLADTCARMLDEAELRLERVSERVARAAAERVEVGASAQQARPIGGGDEMMAVEVTAFEERIVFGSPADSPPPSPPAGNSPFGPLPAEPRGARSPQPSNKPSAPNPGPADKTSELELDPLFDEDD
jgi:exodeoxyribonuclease VII small subunit